MTQCSRNTYDSFDKESPFTPTKNLRKTVADVRVITELGVVISWVMYQYRNSFVHVIWPGSKVNQLIILKKY